jgi:hypothetical protein
MGGRATVAVQLQPPETTAGVESHMSKSSAFVPVVKSGEPNMADAYRSPSSVVAEVKLHQALLARSSLWALCGCGRAAVLDPTPWVGQGLRRQPLANLETRLRCQCGARRAKLEIRGLSEAPAGPTGGIHIFR